MKKLISLIIAIIMISSVLLCACGGDETKETALESETEVVTDDVTDDATEAGTAATETDAETADTEEGAAEPAGTKDEANPFEDLETVSEEFSVTDVGTKYENSRQYNFIKKFRFQSGDNDYSWYEFYNACIAGEIDFTDPSVAEYAETGLEAFEEYGLEDETAQAKTVVELLGDAK